MKRPAFTLIEMMVVVAIIAILMAAMTVSINTARTRARIAKATQEASELTNAILAYEQYNEDRSLASKVTGSWAQCAEGSLSMVLGGETANGNRIPVLFNAALTNGKMLDPWGRPYEYMIEQTDHLGQAGARNVFTGAALPNFFRLTDEERRK